MAEPTTYAGYKVGTLIAMMMGTGVTMGLTPGPWYARILAGFAGGAAAYVGTPLFAPITLKVFGIVYSWFDIPIDQVPLESVIGFTGFGMALVGIDICRWLIDSFGKVLSKIPLGWPSKNKQQE
jgi:hypothetical protein